ncbi:hypothetical protein LB506_008682 [Fusarium annulatum]|nr:hypothetical protein LB506_008682 [Fusarium annulatum]
MRQVMGIISPVSDLFKRMDTRGILTLCRQSPLHFIASGEHNVSSEPKENTPVGPVSSRLGLSSCGLPSPYDTEKR